MTYQSVYNLLKMNLISKSKKEATEELVKKKPEAKKINKQTVIAWMILFLITLVLTAAGIFTRGYTSEFMTMGKSKYDASEAYTLENMDYLLRVYFLRYREFPDKLDRLVEINWINKKDIYSFFYLHTDDGYVLKPLNK